MITTITNNNNNYDSPVPATTSTDKGCDSAKVESLTRMTVIKDELNRLEQRKLEIECLLCSEQRLSLPEDLINKLRKQAKIADIAEKQRLRTLVRASKAAEDRLALLTVQLYLCNQDIAELTSSCSHYESQSLVEEEDVPPKSSKEESDCDLRVFDYEFSAIPRDVFCTAVKQEISSLQKSIASVVVANLDVISKGYRSIDLYHLDSDYQRLLKFEALEARICNEGDDGMRSAEKEKLVNNPEESTKTPSKSKQKKSVSSEERRLKTQITDIARWEQLPWEVPQGNYKIADYQREVVRRSQLAKNVSKRHAQVEKWRREINKYFSKFNEDGTTIFTNTTASPGLNTGTRTYNGIGGNSMTTSTFGGNPGTTLN